jgi:hypothetical protein
MDFVQFCVTRLTQQITGAVRWIDKDRNTLKASLLNSFASSSAMLNIRSTALTHYQVDGKVGIDMHSLHIYVTPIIAAVPK